MKNSRTTRKLLPAIAGLAAVVVALVVFALPASAELRTFLVRLPTGQTVTVTVDAPAGLSMSQVPGLPGVPIQELTPPAPPSPPTVPTLPSPAPQPPSTNPSPPSPPPSSGGGNGSGSGGGGGTKHPTTTPAQPPHSQSGHPQQHTPTTTNSQPSPQGQVNNPKHSTTKKPNPAAGLPQLPAAAIGGQTPAASFFDSLPGPLNSQTVPNFVISNFQVPIFLLPIYQAAGIEYGIRWEVLAGINEVETDYGRNLNVSSAGAVGWMQFLPATWRLYGVDATQSGRRDPYNPVDAIFAAARYLKAAGGQKNIRQGIYAYNHATWYVDSVMMRAQLLATYPAEFIASLSGLTEGHFPVADPQAKYTGAQNVLQQAKQTAKLTQNATTLDVAQPTRRATDIFAKKGAAVIAANDGVVKQLGTSKKLGRYVILQDVYGNQYTYSHLGSISPVYPVLKALAPPTKAEIEALSQTRQQADPQPNGPASAGAQTQATLPQPSQNQRVAPRAAGGAAPAAPVQPSQTPAFKARLFAHPARPQAQSAGGAEQLFAQQTGSGTALASYDGYFSGVLGFNSKNADLKPLKAGSNVIAGTILGRVAGGTPAQPSHLHFTVQPAGKGAPDIDPTPILDGWKLLESTNIYRPNGKNLLYNSGDSLSIGQVLLLSKAQLQKRVLSDPRIKIYSCGRNDIKTGQIDRRVLGTLEYLAESGLYPTVSSLKCGHSGTTTSGNTSEHASGNAVDISAINGIPISGHQDPGGIAEQTVRRLMLLQGTMAPNQIISLLSLGGNTLALPDHANQIFVGFRPLFGQNAKLGQETISILKPNQWDTLISHLDSLPNPVVPTAPSKYAIPDAGQPPLG